MPGQFFNQDALLVASAALPTSTSVTSTGVIDTQTGSYGQFDPERSEFQLQIPAQTSLQMPANDSISFALMSSVNSNGSSPTTEIPTVYTLAGTSNSSGISAVTWGFKTRYGINRYVFLQATGSSTTVAASGTYNLAMVF